MKPTHIRVETRCVHLSFYLQNTFSRSAVRRFRRLYLLRSLGHSLPEQVHVSLHYWTLLVPDDTSTSSCIIALLDATRSRWYINKFLYHCIIGRYSFPMIHQQTQFVYSCPVCIFWIHYLVTNQIKACKLDYITFHLNKKSIKALYRKWYNKGRMPLRHRFVCINAFLFIFKWSITWLRLQTVIYFEHSVGSKTLISALEPKYTNRITMCET